MPVGAERSLTHVPTLTKAPAPPIMTNESASERDLGKYSYARLATVVEQASDAILIADTNGIIEYVNPAFERTTGHRSDEVIGRSSRVFDGRYSDPAMFENMWDTLNQGRAWKGAMANTRKDGSGYQVELTVTPMFRRSGRIVGYSALMRDITQEMELEARLRQAEKMEAIGQLASGVAHDFNNVLTAILGHVSLMRAGIRSHAISLGAVADGLDQLERAARRGASLTRQLLNFNRKRPTRLEPVQPNRVLADTERMLRRLIAQNVTLELQPAPDVGAVMADVCQLEQIILNLAVNARDAMPDGGALTISTETTNLDERYTTGHHDAGTGPHVLISVRDTGTGMSPDVLTHIFEPFFTTKSPGKGTGLGLATVYGIVQRFGGHITVNSGPGEGTEFKIYLPAATEIGDDTPASESSDQPPRGTETVLICEDDEIIRELECEILERQGYTVLAAENGKQALGAAGSKKIDLLITDVMMPGISGKALARELASTRPDLKVLFVSGHTNDDSATPELQGISAPLLPKPFTAMDLLSQVRETIDNRKPN